MAAVIRTPLLRITVPGGDVMRALRSSDAEFKGFGEAYFSMIEEGAVKGWKRSLTMTKTLVVPLGRVRFAFVQDGLKTGNSQIETYELSPDEEDSYARLTVPPGLWMAFAGVGPGTSIILNMADRIHNPAEAQSAPLEKFDTPWSGR